MNPDPLSNPKYLAIEAHESQGSWENFSYISQFFHSDEFFWVETIGTGVPAPPAPVFSQDGGTVAPGFDLTITNPGGSGTDLLHDRRF